jgi:hypothetical protein
MIAPYKKCDCSDECTEDDSANESQNGFNHSIKAVWTPQTGGRGGHMSAAGLMAALMLDDDFKFAPQFYY